MKENQKIIKYKSGNTKIETYTDEDTFVTKHYYDGKDAYVRELIYLTDGIKKIKYTNSNGVVTKVDHFIEDKRHGLETKYFISKADGTIKSTKIYDNGKLHGENVIYNERGKIIKHEIFALGKPIAKYLREDDDTNEITSVKILNEANIQNLPQIEYEKLQRYLQNKEES